MAAMGVLRVLAKDRKLAVRLGWQDGHAVFDGIDTESIAQELFENMNGRADAPEFNWQASLSNVPVENYRKSCIAMAGDERALGFMAGWATDAVLGKDGCVTKTRMDMTSGQQKLVANLGELARKITIEHFDSALNGGPYEKQSSFGLIPIRSHAHEYQDPTKPTNPVIGKPGLIWLAFESIPLHPVVPESSFRATTTGWSTRPVKGYKWPIWEGDLTIDEIFFLRALPLDQLSSRPGITEVWFSRYSQSGKYGMLQSAKRER
jgi:hypothetical protein